MHFLHSAQQWETASFYVQEILNWQQKLNKKNKYNVIICEKHMFMFFQMYSDSVSEGCALMYMTLCM